MYQLNYWNSVSIELLKLCINQIIEIMYQSNYDQRVLSGCCCATTLDKAPRLSIVIWILSSDTDTDTICQLNQFNTNSKAAMLSTPPESPSWQA